MNALQRVLPVALVLLVGCSGLHKPGPMEPGDGSTGILTEQWNLTVASWNVMNLSMSKATFPAGGDRINLLTAMGNIAGAYDIIVFQEVLQTGASVTAHLANYLPPTYLCAGVSAASGRVGRQERYVICAPPTNATGTITIVGYFDYSTAGGPYVAADGTPQPAANVWMRPPYVATVTYTPNNPNFAPLTFDIYTNHTKPAYGYSAHARPPGTVAGAPNSSSVHYELRAIEQNLRAGANKLVIGDLNADCASYPVGWRGQDFAAAAGWHWYVNYGQRTNTAVGTTCGYDRIIVNTPLNAFKRGHGVDYDHYGNATRIDAKRVSDHYPVWVEFGEVRTVKRPALTSASSVPVNAANKRRRYSPANSVNIRGFDLLPSATSARLYVTSYTTANNYRSNFSYPLIDVRGAASPVTTDSNGNFTHTVHWSQPTIGAYTFVFDANGDGQFSLADGDFVNEAVEADILVSHSTGNHGDVVSVGDNMLLRDVFDLGQAYNIYAVAQNLPANISGDAYIVSNRLLGEGGYTSWAQARAANIRLAPFSIPIRLSDVGMISTSTVTDADRTQPFTSNSDGGSFFSIWPRPGQLMNASVNYTSPPASVFKPAFAGNGDPPASPDDTGYVDDPCANAAESFDQDFQQSCNLGFTFSNYYGNSFNIVLDLNANGVLDATDPIDVRDIGDMTNYFSQGHQVLGPNANGDPAVSEYKEYLERALSISLSAGATYDQETRNASQRYACSSELSAADFAAFIVADSQTGFRVLDDDQYHSERNHGTGLYQFDSAALSSWSGDGATQCIGANSLSYVDEFNLSNQSKTTSVANQHRAQNVAVSTDNSSLCLLAVESAVVVDEVAIGVGVGTSFITAGTGLILGAIVAGGANLVAGGLCAL